MRARKNCAQAINSSISGNRVPNHAENHRKHNTTHLGQPGHGDQERRALRQWPTFLALSVTWEKEFLAPSVARSTGDAFNIVCLLDHDGKLMSPHKTRSKNVPTRLLRDRQHTQDFAGPISLRASEVLGSISCYHMKLASRASRPGLTVGCASFATDCARLTDFTLRVMNECVVLDVRMNPTPSPTTTNALFCMVCLFLFGDKQRVLPRITHLLHDLITQTFLQRLHNGIVVMGFIDVFVHAHHQHRRNIENPRNLGDCTTEENQIHDGYYFCLRSRTRQHASQDTRLRSYIGTSAC